MKKIMLVCIVGVGLGISAHAQQPSVLGTFGNIFYPKSRNPIVCDDGQPPDEDYGCTRIDQPAPPIEHPPYGGGGDSGGGNPEYPIPSPTARFHEMKFMGLLAQHTRAIHGTDCDRDANGDCNVGVPRDKVAECESEGLLYNPYVDACVIPRDPWCVDRDGNFDMDYCDPDFDPIGNGPV